MPVQIVQSKHNARLKELRRALAAAGRSDDGCIGIEGPNLIGEALRAGLSVHTIFVAQGAERLLEPFVMPSETEILLVPHRLLQAALATETPQPVAALVEPPEWTWAHLPAAQNNRAALVMVLAGIQDPGNLGTILRSAEAFGASGAVSLPGTVSAWNQKAVRASAGSVFRVPLLAASEKECLERLREAGIKILAAAVRDAQPADQMDMAGPVALVIGNEGAGIANQLAAKCDANITVPCPGRVESLNAAVAASVLLYEAARQRAARQQRSPLNGGPDGNRSQHRGAGRGAERGAGRGAAR